MVVFRQVLVYLVKESDFGADVFAEWGLYQSMSFRSFFSPNGKTDNGTTYFGTTPHSAKTSAPIQKAHFLKSGKIEADGET